MNIKNLFMGLLTVALMAGCQDDDKNSEASFSTLTIEQQKENLENAGINAIDKLEGLSDLKAIPVFQDFSDLPSYQDPNEALEAFILPVITLKEGANAPFKLKSSSPSIDSFSELFQEESGIYTYNETTHS